MEGKKKNNEIEKKSNRENSEIKCWYFEKMNKIGKPPTRLIKKREREGRHKSLIRSERGYIAKILVTIKKQ
jgi:hypothetical protein